MQVRQKQNKIKDLCENIKLKDIRIYMVTAPHGNNDDDDARK